jgi:hypothetical protein
VAHRARLDVPAPILKAVTASIARHRRRPGARLWQRAATVHAQVLLVLRWLRHHADPHTLARATGVSDATAYRDLHEGLDVIASHAPHLQDVLVAERAAGTVYLCLDGTLIPTDRVAARVEVNGEPRHHSGTRASTTPSAATSKSSPTRPAGRCGPPRYRPAPPTT